MGLPINNSLLIIAAGISLLVKIGIPLLLIIHDFMTL